MAVLGCSGVDGIGACGGECRYRGGVNDASGNGFRVLVMLMLVVM